MLGTRKKSKQTNITAEKSFSVAWIKEPQKEKTKKPRQTSLCLRLSTQDLHYEVMEKKSKESGTLPMSLLWIESTADVHTFIGPEKVISLPVDAESTDWVSLVKKQGGMNCSLCSQFSGPGHYEGWQLHLQEQWQSCV
jgi:hypothetical protein